MDFNAQSIRDYIHQQPLKREDVPTPFWPEANGHICLQDIPSEDLLNLTNLCKHADGKLDLPKYMSSMICMALVVKETGEVVFPLTDRDFVAKLGSSILTPVFKQVQKFFGIGDDVVETAKNALVASLS